MNETETLEFKSEFSKTFLKTVSAFSNYDGGEILFGVADDGTAVGLQDPKSTCLDIENSINDSIDPMPRYLLSIEELEGKQIVRLSVMEGYDKPYYYGKYAYKRSHTSTVKVDRQELNHLILEGRNLSFEELPAKDQSLDFSLLKAELKDKKGLSVVDENTFRTLDLLSAEGVYNNAAAILADKNHFPGIDIVKFGDSIDEFFHREIHEEVSIIQLYKSAIELFRLYYEAEVVKGMDRVKTHLIPEEAFRETIANALAHRDWGLHANIRIALFDDKVQVTSPGSLPKGISENEYLEGRISVLRNPILSNVLFHLGYMERFGTGVLRIKNAYKDSLVIPTFDFRPNSMTVTLPTLSSVANLSEDEQAVLHLAKREQTITRSDVESFLGLSPNKASRVLKSLTEQGLLKKEGAARATRYLL